MIAPYVMAACQPSIRTVFDGEGVFRPQVLDANVDHLCALVARAAREHGARLIVFPQFGLSGFKLGVSIDDWIGASLTFPGPHTERLGRAARAAGAHVVVQATEAHPAFPGRYFSTAALIGPDGGLRLTYRKNYVMTTRTRPIDVYDAFVRQFGADALFPVADTPLGRIGLAIAGEVNWPEVTRTLALKGAEVIANPTASPRLDYLGGPGALAVRPARAFENLVYLGMANMGEFLPQDGAAPDPGPPPPPSEIHDFTGALIGQAPVGPDQFALATIDIEALRAARARPTANFLAQIQPAIHQDPGALARLWPANAFADRRVEAPGDLVAVEAAVWRRLQDAAGQGPSG